MLVQRAFMLLFCVAIVDMYSRYFLLCCHFLSLLEPFPSLCPFVKIKIQFPNSVKPLLDHLEAEFISWSYCCAAPGRTL